MNNVLEFAACPSCHAARGKPHHRGCTQGTIETRPYLPVPVEAAKTIGEGFKKSMVIVNAWDEEHQLLHTTTWGDDPAHKAMAADGGRIAAKALDADLLQVHAFEDYRLTTAVKLLGALKAMATFHGAAHDSGLFRLRAPGFAPSGDCPGGDTCRCRFKPFNDLVNRTIDEAEEALGPVEEAAW